MGLSQTNIAPIFKKGNTPLMENSRTVSLTYLCCKFIEHVVVRHMLKHFEQQSMLTTLQHGFCAAHSSATQFFINIHDLMQYQYKRTQVDIIILNLLKAFDTVLHSCLLWKLSRYRIRGPLLQWISSFLKIRSQRVIIGRRHSDWLGWT